MQSYKKKENRVCDVEIVVQQLYKAFKMKTTAFKGDFFYFLQVVYIYILIFALGSEHQEIHSRLLLLPELLFSGLFKTLQGLLFSKKKKLHKPFSVDVVPPIYSASRVFK